VDSLASTESDASWRLENFHRMPLRSGAFAKQHRAWDDGSATAGGRG